MRFKPVFIEATTLDDCWFQLLSALHEHGRRYKITEGSYAGHDRLVFDDVSGFIHKPHERPLAPMLPESSSLPRLTTDEDIEQYFADYLMNGKKQLNEDYKYATFIAGGTYEIPEFVRYYNDGTQIRFSNFPVIVPNQIDWIIKHFKEKGFGNEHCYLTVGYPESSLAYDIPYTTEIERKTSPCVIKNTKILTKEGFKYVQDVIDGDIVLTHNGNWKKVIKTYRRFYQGKINILKKRFYKSVLGVTPDHPILSYKIEKCQYDKNLKCKPTCKKQSSVYAKYGCPKLYENYEYKWEDSENLSINHYLPFPKIKDEIDCPYSDREMYLFGLFLAEGDYSGGRGLRFNLGLHEEDLHEKCINYIKEEYNIDPCFDTSSQGSLRITFCKASLSREWENMFGKGTRNKTIPMEFIFFPKNKLQLLIDGYADGDGWKRKKDRNRVIDNETSIFTSSINLCNMFKLILNKLNIIPSITIRKPTQNVYQGRIIKANGEGYDITFWNSDKRSSTSFQNDDYLYVPLMNNEKIDYEGFVYNLEVEDDNSYIADDFVVHNCLRGLDFGIVEKDGEYALHTKVIYRSWHLAAGFPVNMGGFTLLNEYVANELGIEPGPLSFTSKSLHCYDFDLEYLKARLGKV